MQRDPLEWAPTRVLSFEKAYESSTKVFRVRTDCGVGFLKTMGNPEGLHTLPCEWIGSNLAKWFGLPTFDFSIFRLAEECPFVFRGRSDSAIAGPAFSSRESAGESWSGRASELAAVFNREDFGRLVAIDTLVRNQDRYFPRPPSEPRNSPWNVFLRPHRVEGRLEIVAMDFSHALTNGREIGPQEFGIDAVKDSRIYGRFPAFEPYLVASEMADCGRRLLELTAPIIQGIVDAIPVEWELNRTTRATLVDFLAERARYLGSPETSSGRPTIAAIMYPESSFF